MDPLDQIDSVVDAGHDLPKGSSNCDRSLKTSDNKLVSNDVQCKKLFYGKPNPDVSKQFLTRVGRRQGSPGIENVIVVRVWF